MAKLKQIGKIWYSDFTVPKGRHLKTGRVTYRRIRRALSKDKKIAIIKLSRLLEQFGTDKHKAPDEISWEGFKEKFMPQKAHRVTKTLYTGAIRNLEEFAANKTPIKSLKDVTPALLDQAKAAWKANGRGLYIVNRHVRCIKAMMRVAESWKNVEKQDWSGNREDKEPKGRLLWYPREELKELIPHCRGHWKTLTLLGSRGGLRRSEIFWLPWTGGVDFVRNRIHIAPVYDDDGTLLWEPKDHERRWVPMPKDLKKHLKGLKRDGRWVLMDGKDRPSLEGLSVYYRKILRKAGLKGSIHTLRHTYGSHLANGGATAKMIMELMGHSSLEMVDKYMHLAPSTLQDATKFLPEI